MPIKLLSLSGIGYILSEGIGFSSPNGGMGFGSGRSALTQGKGLGLDWAIALCISLIERELILQPEEVEDKSNEMQDLIT